MKRLGILVASLACLWAGAAFGQAPEQWQRVIGAYADRLTAHETEQVIDAVQTFSRYLWADQGKNLEEAEAAIIESAKLDKEEGPQKEVDRQKKEAENLEVARQISRKTFHP